MALLASDIVSCPRREETKKPQPVLVVLIIVALWYQLIEDFIGAQYCMTTLHESERLILLDS
jgi:hypothetical protein